jgi:hypothetical protein
MDDHRPSARTRRLDLLTTLALSPDGRGGPARARAARRDAARAGARTLADMTSYAERG